jgi:Asp-tRNA(Asn)/Glu-tRNA(Gln) amidotransferase A subunit family amidase
MRAAGALIIGKTNVPEYGYGSNSYNPLFGLTRNAYDPSKVGGGSSGGAGVALALRMLPPMAATWAVPSAIRRRSTTCSASAPRRA